MRKPFRDDSTPADKRANAVSRLMVMCPRAYRAIMRPYVEMAIANCADSEVESLLLDASTVESLAKTGDWNSVVGIARKYGASDALIQQFAPGLIDGGMAPPST